MDNFLVVRLSSLGDIIHTLPAFAALRRGFPDATVSWIVERPGKEILDLVPGITRIVVRGEKGWLKKIKKRDQTALDFQGLLKSSVIAFLSGSSRRIGFSEKNLKERAASFFYTEKLDEFAETGHVIDKNLRLLRKVGLNSEGREFPMAIPLPTRRAVQNALTELGRRPEQPILLCNVGAAWESKRWPAERWIEMLGMIPREPFFPLLLWGNETEKEIVRRIVEKTGTTTAPFFSIQEVLALITESRLLVSGDTFALQAACALDVPVLGLFGPTSPIRNGPFRQRDRIVQAPMDCQPCYKKTCRSKKCMEAIAAKDVAARIAELMNHD